MQKKLPEITNWQFSLPPKCNDFAQLNFGETVKWKSGIFTRNLKKVSCHKIKEQENPQQSMNFDVKISET